MLYSTSTVHEEHKDMLYSGSTDSGTGSSTVVVQGSKLFCAGTVAQGYCGTIEACPPCTPRTENESCEVLDHFSAAASWSVAIRLQTRVHCTYHGLRCIRRAVQKSCITNQTQSII